MVEQEGFLAVTNVFSLILLETILAIVSLPLYLNLRPEKVAAFLEEKGGYEKITFDYNLRRILTLTGVGIILFIWIIKLLLIILVPVVFGPLKLYSISDLRPPDLMAVNTDLIKAETDIQTARTTSSLTVPELKEVKKSQGKNFIFYGVGQPNSTVVLLLSDLQTAVYTGEVGSDGFWKIDHSQKDFKLNEGNHSVLAFTFDESSKTRSQFSNEQYFKVRTSFLDIVIREVDVLANWSVVVILFVGMFLVFLTV